VYRLKFYFTSEFVRTVSVKGEREPMTPQNWGNCTTQEDKLELLRKQCDALSNLMAQNFQTLESRFKALEAEQARLAEAIEHETKRSKRAARSH